jgi:Domain of Unknown Function (DUF928)
MKTTHRSRVPWLGAVIASLVLVAGAPSHVGSRDEVRDAASQGVRSEKGHSPEAAKPAETKPVPVLYVPPEVGFPARRIGAGTRGMGRVATVQILAPDHLGYTTQEQPTLYWYLAEPTTTRVEFAIHDETSVEPLAVVELPSPSQPGIQALRLADHGVKLQPGVRYLWFVSLVPEPERRSKDFVVGGWISRREPDAMLGGRLAAAEGRDALVYAESGLWYDAIGSLSAEIAAAPADPAPLEQRAALLEQVGLSEVAAYDRERAQEQQ